jgi:ribosomal protein S12 methylthiotransferase
MIKKDKVGIVTLGCSKNTVDSERLMNQLHLNNYDLVEDPNKADTVIINTCGFIEAAKQESIDTILQAVELKKAGKISKVLVAGCLSARYKNNLQEEIPEVDGYFGTEDYSGILNHLGADLKYELLGERFITKPRHYAYLKISEGCDNPCSFCAIPLMRGNHKTKPVESLVEETKFLAGKKVKEVIIIGQDTTDYGIDLYGKRNLADLLSRLIEVNGIEWIRLLYAYPSHFPDDVVKIIAENPKVLKYIDVPLQHISDKILKSMRRGITSRRTKELIDKLRERIPGLILRTTFIVGYPNETEEDFNLLCNFVKDIRFDKLGIFTYSQEENTQSFTLGDPVPEKVKEERKSILMEIQKEISLQKNKNLVGSYLDVLVDDIEGNGVNSYFIARSYRDAPEVDGEVLIPAKDNNLTIGSFYKVRIYECNEYDLFGSMV